MTTRFQDISVIHPIGQAFEQMKRLLFQPFDIGKWIVIGFCAWLAHLAEQGSNPNFRWSKGQWNEMRHTYDKARDYVMHNLGWIVPLAIVVLLIIIAISVALLWVNSRGKFMFLHCVALDRADIKDPWHWYAMQANSLFWFRLVLGLIAWVLMLPFVVLTTLLIIKAVHHHSPWPGPILAIAAAVLPMVLIGIVVLVIKKLTIDFVVPTMYLRRRPCLECWREVRGLMTANLGAFIVYLLFQIVIKIVIGSVILAAMLATCCLLACPLALPYLGTVLLLPIFVFNRAYSLFYLAQFGPEYNTFPAPTTPTA